MSTKGSSSLSELRSLREAVLAEEKAKTQAILANLPPSAYATEPAIAEEPIAPDFQQLPPGEEEVAAGPSVLDPLPEPLSDALPEPVEPESFAPPPPPTPKFAPPPAAPKVAPPPPPSPAAQEKPAGKAPALIVPLTPRIQQQLQRHIEESRWSASDLVMELIRTTLHHGYPTIQFEHKVLARSSAYRTFERNPLESTLKIVSGQGVFLVSAKPESADYQNWLSYFTGENAPNPELSASQICLYNLQNYLESLDDYTSSHWVKRIPSDQFELEAAPTAGGVA